MPLQRNESAKPINSTTTNILKKYADIIFIECTSDVAIIKRFG